MHLLKFCANIYEYFFFPPENKVAHVLSNFTVALVSTLRTNQAKKVISGFYPILVFYNIFTSTCTYNLSRTTKKTCVSSVKIAFLSLCSFWYIHVLVLTFFSSGGGSSRTFFEKIPSMKWSVILVISLNKFLNTSNPCEIRMSPCEIRTKSVWNPCEISSKSLRICAAVLLYSVPNV